MQIELKLFSIEAAQVLNYAKKLLGSPSADFVNDISRMYSRKDSDGNNCYVIDVHSQEELDQLNCLKNLIDTSTQLLHVGILLNWDIPNKYLPDWNINVKDFWKQAVPKVVMDYDGPDCELLDNVYDNWFRQIGEAMGPVCYTGFCLIDGLKKLQLPYDWVIDCIKFYENNMEVNK